MVVLENKNVLIIIAAQNFRDEEYEKPRRILEEEGARVTVASTSLNPSKGVRGMIVKPDVLLQDVNPNDFQAVIFVGGVGSRQYFDDPIAHSIARKMFDDDKIVSAIFIAPVILVNAGLLADKKATVFSSEIGTLRAKGVNYTNVPVAKDGNIVTACGPEAAEQFGRILTEALSSKSN
jgi:protease I